MNDMVDLNCYLAYDVGTNLLQQFHSMKFSKVKFQKSGCVLTLKSSTKLKVRNENRAVDLLILFKRISILKMSDAQLRKYSRYELAIYP